MKPFLIVLALVCVGLCTTAASCQHNLQATDVGIAQSLFAIQDTAENARARGEFSDQAWQDFNAKLVPILQSGQTLNRIVMAWQPGQPTPSTVLDALFQMRSLLASIEQTAPEPVKAAIKKALDLIGRAS